MESSIDAEVMRGNFASTDDALAAAWRASKQTKAGRKQAGKGPPPPRLETKTKAVTAKPPRSFIDHLPSRLRLEILTSHAKLEGTGDTVL